jgi:hypothetical protein
MSPLGRLARLHALIGICGEVDGADEWEAEALALWDAIFACEDNEALWALDEKRHFLTEDCESPLDKFKQQLTNHHDFVMPYLLRAQQALLNERERASAIAGLRALADDTYTQRELDAIATDGGRLKALDKEEIQDLIGRLLT